MSDEAAQRERIKAASAFATAPAVTAPLLLEQMMKRIEGIADEVRALREEQRRHFDPGAGTTQHAGADSRLHA